MTESRWTLPSGLELRWDEHGALIADVPPPAERAVPLSGDDAVLLSLFAEPRQIEEALAAFVGRHEHAPGTAELAHARRRIAGFCRRSLLVNEPRARERGSPFAGYASPAMHVEMLSDYVRTCAYREALAKHVSKRTVLEIGCGSGVLACFAARAGATRVYAIESSPIIEVARDVIKRNGFEHAVTLIEGRSDQVELPERVDVIYSELIGTDPLEEGLVRILRDAVDRFLAPGGCVLPRHLRLSACGVESQRIREAVEEKSTTSTRVHGLTEALGLDMGPMTDAVQREVANLNAHRRWLTRLGNLAGARRLPPDTIVTTEVVLAKLDCLALDPELHTRSQRRLQAIRDGHHNAMAVYFTAHFDDEISVATTPYAGQEATNWGGQLLYPLEGLNVRRGDELSVELDLAVSRDRSLLFRRHGSAGHDQADVRVLNPRIALGWDVGTSLEVRIPPHGESLSWNAELIPLLEQFTTPHRPQEGTDAFLANFARSKDHPEISERVHQLVTELELKGALVSVDQRTLLAARPRLAASSEVTFLDHCGPAYQEVIARNAADRTVLTLGPGSGTLACLAAQAGAKAVYAAVEPLQRDLARELLRVNNLERVARVVETDTLPWAVPESADLVVAGLSGDLHPRLLPISPLPSAVAALLSRDAITVPRRVSLVVTAVEVAALRCMDYILSHKQGRAGALEEHFALDLSPLFKRYAEECAAARRSWPTDAELRELTQFAGYENECYPLSSPVATDTFDIAGARAAPAPVVFEIEREGVHNATLVSFTADLDETTEISTDPSSEFAGWGQSLTPVPEKVVRPLDRSDFVGLVEEGLAQP